MSPNHAARFVSLISLKTTDRGPSGDRLEVWHRFPTFLALKSGDFEDHCLLLCSLFLGFNLDAYVIFGSSADRPHGWVMTRL
jgi:centrosomal protein CEP76